MPCLLLSWPLECLCTELNLCGYREHCWNGVLDRHGINLVEPHLLLLRRRGFARYPHSGAAMFGSGGCHVYCRHCKDYLSKSAYYPHWRQFFDHKKEWRLNVAADEFEASSSEEDIPSIHSANEGSSNDEQQTLEMPGLVFKAGVPVQYAACFCRFGPEQLTS